MSESGHAAWERRITACHLGTLGAVERARLFEHLRACEACRRVYDRHSAVEAALVGTGHVLPPAALERIAGGVLVSPDRARRRVLGGVGLALALATVGLAAVLARRPADDGFAPRGGGEGAWPEGPSLRALALRPGASGLEAVDLATAPARRGDRLRVLVSGAEPGDRARLVWSTPGGGGLLVEDAPVEPGLDRPLGPALSVPDGAGPLELELELRRGATTRRRSLTIRLESGQDDGQ